jgi:hypothetical protein
MMILKNSWTVFLIIILGSNCIALTAGDNPNKLSKPESLFDVFDNDSTVSPVEFISSYIENGSPLFWEYNPDGSVLIRLIYDRERASPNRASNHWHFQVHARKGAEVTLILEFFYEVWNARKGGAYHRIRNYYISTDGINWETIPVEIMGEFSHKLRFKMDSEKLYVAGMEPYRISDLEKFLEEIRDNPVIDISPIGNTVEGRQLEIIRIGHEEAHYRILIRARSHPWEAGLTRSLLDSSRDSERFLGKYCVYILPMANKDGVYRGLTRFNSSGMDLNRNWDLPADPLLAPENFALESWLHTMISEGKKPHLAIDFHNDRGGRLHISRPDINLDNYLSNMERFESLLYKHTWFTEGSTGQNFRNPGTFGEGLVERFGIDAFVFELNQIWIEGLKKEPFGKDWELLGKQLREVFYDYFDD